MSYILDALKKSEQQRPPGRGPELFTVHGPLPPRRFPWLPLAVAALVAGAVALGIWIGYASRGPAARPVAVPAAPVEERSAQPSAVPFPAAAPQPPTEPARRPAASPRPAKGAGAGTAPLPALPAASPPVEAPAVPPTTVPDPLPAAGPAPTPSPVAAPAAPPAPAALAPAAAAPAPAATPAPPEVEPEAGNQEIPAAPQPPEIPPPDGRILDLSELPASVRGDLGAVGLTGHVWSEEPSLRLVTVEDRMLREGAEIRPGLRLEEITPAGAVLGFRGYRFRIGGSAP